MLPSVQSWILWECSHNERRNMPRELVVAASNKDQLYDTQTSDGVNKHEFPGCAVRAF